MRWRMRLFRLSPSTTLTMSKKASPLSTPSVNPTSKGISASDTQQVSLHRDIIQARQRQAVPLQLAFVMSSASGDVGVCLEVDDMPASFSFKCQIDHAFQHAV